MIKRFKEKLLVYSDNLMAKNMAVSSICKPISMIISYLYVPIVLDYLGVEKYGVWATILTILSWIGYFDIGIGNGLRNKLTESLSEKDGRSRNLVSSAYAFITAIMIVAAILFSIFASCVNWNRVFGVNDVHESLTALVIFSVCFMALNFILSICKNVLYALQRAADVSIMELAVQTLNMVGVLVAMRFMKSNLFVMAAVYGGSTMIVNLVASIIIYKKNSNVKPSIKTINIADGKNLTSLGLQFFIIQICALVLFTSDSLIISYLYGAADVTPYNTVNKLFNVIIGVFGAMIAPVWSNVTKLKAEKNYDGIKGLITKIHFAMVPFFIGTCLLAVFFKPLTKVWLGRELAYTTSMIIFGATYCLLSIWCNTYAAFLNGMQIMKFTIIIACMEAVANIPLSLFMAQILELHSAGVLGGTVFSMLISAIASPIILNHEFKKLKCCRGKNNIG